MGRLDDRRLAAKHLTPRRDQAKDAIRAFMFKVFVAATIILVIVLISVTNEPPK